MLEVREERGGVSNQERGDKSNDQNNDKHGYIINIDGYFNKNTDKTKIKKKTLKFIQIF